MTEKLVIVTIDAGSDVRGRVLDQERVGTSSGKGTMASAIRRTDSLAYDSGCAYRSIALRAMMEGIKAEDPNLQVKLLEWADAGNFSHSDRGLSLFGMDIDEKLLHGSDISNTVAEFGSASAVRTYTKHMKVQWLGDYASSSNSPLVAFDGREMRQFVQEKVLSRGFNFEPSLLASFVMVVDPIEAAHRRMANRGEIKYGEKGWQVHPALVKTHEELKRRALKDEDRPVDGVGMPDEFILFSEKDGKLALNEDHRPRDLSEALREKVPIVLDTTGVSPERVTSTGLSVIRTALVMSGSTRELALAEKISSLVD